MKVKMFTLAFVSVVALGLGLTAHTNVNAQRVDKEMAQKGTMSALDIQPTDRVMGNPNAKVTVIEYASMTCGHCANFHNTYFKAFKEAYIDTGKVRFIQREMPWDGLSLAVSKIIRCAPQEKYYDFIDAFMSMQNQWVRSSDPLGELKRVARLGGMEGEAVEACIADRSVHEEVLAIKQMGLDQLNVEGTPAFFINGKKFEGVQTTEQLKSAIDPLLGE